VKEGQEVRKGQVLCELESDTERQALHIALSRVREYETRLALILDELKRTELLSADSPSDAQSALRVSVLKVRELEARLDRVLDELKRIEALLRIGGIAERDYSQKSLEAEELRRQIATAKSDAEVTFSQKTLETELLRRQISTAASEVELKRRELDTLVLRSPMDGFLYKFDVRLANNSTLTTISALCWEGGKAGPNVCRELLARQGTRRRSFPDSRWRDARTDRRRTCN